MKKYFMVLVWEICFICFLSSCAKANETQEDTPGLNSSFFFPPQITSCTYEGYVFWELSAQPAEIILSVTQVPSFPEGNLFELKINCSENTMDRFGTDRSRLGFFLVQEDKIYFIDSETSQNESLTMSKTAQEELINAGKIVCSETGTEDVLNENAPGWHEYILADGDRREYHGYSLLTETGYYECFIWELGKGLVEYRSGYGAEADAVNLYRIF